MRSKYTHHYHYCVRLVIIHSIYSKVLITTPYKCCTYQLKTFAVRHHEFIMKNSHSMCIRFVWHLVFLFASCRLQIEAAAMRNETKLWIKTKERRWHYDYLYRKTTWFIWDEWVSCAGGYNNNAVMVNPNNSSRNLNVR